MVPGKRFAWWDVYLVSQPVKQKKDIPRGPGFGGVLGGNTGRATKVLGIVGMLLSKETLHSHLAGKRCRSHSRRCAAAVLRTRIRLGLLLRMSSSIRASIVGTVVVVVMNATTKVGVAISIVALETVGSVVLLLFAIGAHVGAPVGGASMVAVVRSAVIIGRMSRTLTDHRGARGWLPVPGRDMSTVSPRQGTRVSSGVVTADGFCSLTSILRGSRSSMLSLSLSALACVEGMGPKNSRINIPKLGKSSV
jgi:hypothetical protein